MKDRVFLFCFVFDTWRSQIIPFDYTFGSAWCLYILLCAANGQISLLGVVSKKKKKSSRWEFWG